jgi:uncharacterized protein YabE (DUF348 family)
MLYRRSHRPPLHPLVLLAILIGVFGAVIGSGVYILTAMPVIVTIEDVAQRVRTHQRSVEGLLSELGLLVDAEDVVAPSLDAPIQSGMTVTINKAEPMALEVDGRAQRFRTHLIQPHDILAEVGISLGGQDLLIVDGVPFSDQLLATPPRSIQVIRAIKVAVVADGESTPMLTTARTVAGALQQARIDLYLADQVTPALSAVLAEGDTITIRRSVKVYVEVDGRVLQTRTHGSTIGDALAEIGVVPNGLDYTIPAESAPIEAEMTIRIVRVSEREFSEQVPIPFPRTTEVDPALRDGEQRMVQPGVAGVQEVTVRLRRENGREVSRTTPSAFTIQTAQPQIMAVGPSATPTPTRTPTPSVTPTMTSTP